MITNLQLRGIGEKPGANMLTHVASRLDPTLFHSIEVLWPAEYGPAPTPLGMSFAKSLRLGVPMVIDAIRRDPNPVILNGYSGGAALAKIVMNQIESGIHGTDLEVLAVANIADPYRPIGNGAPVSAGWGLAGRMPISTPEFQIASLNDVICCADGNSPLRIFEDDSEAFSAADFMAWTFDLIERIERNRWQHVEIDFANPVAVWQQFTKAKADLDGYLSQGHHTSYAIGGDRAPTARLAVALNTWACTRKAAGVVA